jgi:hypothetical protein
LKLKVAEGGDVCAARVSVSVSVSVSERGV